MSNLFDKDSLEIICPKRNKRIKQLVAWFRKDTVTCPQCKSPINTAEFRKGIADAVKSVADIMKPR